MVLNLLVHPVYILMPDIVMFSSLFFRPLVGQIVNLKNLSHQIKTKVYKDKEAGSRVKGGNFLLWEAA